MEKFATKPTRRNKVAGREVISNLLRGSLKNVKNAHSSCLFFITQWKHNYVLPSTEKKQKNFDGKEYFYTCMHIPGHLHIVCRTKSN